MWNSETEWLTQGSQLVNGRTGLQTMVFKLQQVFSLHLFCLHVPGQAVAVPNDSVPPKHTSVVLLHPWASAYCGQNWPELRSHSTQAAPTRGASTPWDMGEWLKEKFRRKANVSTGKDGILVCLIRECGLLTSSCRSKEDLRPQNTGSQRNPERHRPTYQWPHPCGHLACP